VQFALLDVPAKGQEKLLQLWEWGQELFAWQGVSVNEMGRDEVGKDKPRERS
jgi:hypothetical protein